MKSALRLPQLRCRRGQVIPLLVVLFPVLVGMIGASADVSIIMMGRRAAQDAADLAALAGASQLPEAPNAARDYAIRFAGSNGLRNGVNGTRVVATTPYAGDNAKILVTIDDSIPTSFMRLFGFRGFRVTSRAVAKRLGRPYGVFAGGACGQNRSGIVWTGSQGQIAGNVHTNGNLRVAGSGHDFLGDVSYSCSLDAPQATFRSPPTQRNAQTPPVSVSRSDLPCTYTFAANTELERAGAWWVGGAPTSRQLRPGVYCSSGPLRLSGSGYSGNVTFVVNGGVAMTGSGHNFTPFRNDILIFDDAATSVAFHGSGGRWGGYIYAPYAEVVFTGSGGFLLAGAIVSAAVTTHGSGWNIDPSLGAPPRLSLVE